MAIQETKLIDWRYGEIEVFSGDTFIGRSIELYGEWAQQEIDFVGDLIKAAQARTLLIAGGNIGVQTIAFGKLLAPHGTVHTFEIHPQIFAVLERNLRRSGLSNVIAYQKGLWSRDTQVTVPAFFQGAEMNFGGFSLKSEYSLSDHGSETQLCAIDSLQLPSCDLLFMDIEGAEIEALYGAEDTIRRCRPLVFAEVRNAEEGIPLYNFLKALDYVLFRYATTAFNPANFYNNKEDIFGPAREKAILAIPVERLDTFHALIAQVQDLVRTDTLETFVDSLRTVAYYRCRFFWAAEQGAFVEAHSLTRYLSFDPAAQEVSFTIPVEQVIHYLRVDIVDRPGLAKIKKLKVWLKEGQTTEVVLNLDSAAAVNGYCLKKDVAFIPGTEEHGFMFLSNSVHFMFRLPQQVTAGHEREIRLQICFEWPGASEKFYINTESLLSNADTILEQKLEELIAGGIKWGQERDDWFAGQIDAIGKMMVNVAERSDIQRHEVRKALKQMDRVQQERARDVEASSRSFDRLNARLLSLAGMVQSLEEKQKMIADAQENVQQQISRLTTEAQPPPQDGLVRWEQPKTTQGRREDPHRSFWGNIRTVAAGVAKRLPLISSYLHERHIQKDMAVLRNSSLFDEAYYQRNNPDVLESKMIAVRHYLLHGGLEGRAPSAAFDSEAYLVHYPDVKASGINPLFHYLTFGKDEGRSIFAAGTSEKNLPFQLLHQAKENERKRLTPEIPNSDQQAPPVTNILRRAKWNAFDQYYAAPMTFAVPADPKGPQHLDLLYDQIRQNLTWKQFFLSLSHDNYLESVGGLQLYLQDEAAFLKKNEVSYIHIFPKENTPWQLSYAGDGFELGINVDGRHLGFVRSGEWISLLERVLQNTDCFAVFVHHLMSWDGKLVDYLLGRLKTAEKILALHDFFTVCAQYTLLRNGRSFCAAPAIGSNACQICEFSGHRQKQLPLLQELIQKHKLKALAPSTVTANIWKRYYPDTELTLVPHLLLQADKNKPGESRDPSRKLRIAFLGHPNPLKGWTIWRQLIDTYRLGFFYDCFHFGSRSDVNPEYFAAVRVSAEHRDEMVKTLREHEIDVVLLWSIMPETFSYTLYEATSAGCYVITHASSGNIAGTISERQNGIILDDETELIRLLTERNDLFEENVAAFQKKGRKYFRISTNMRVQQDIVEAKKK